MFQILRLAFAGLLFLLSLLNIIPAPTNIFWKLSILAMEWGHLLAIGCLLLVIGNNGSGVLNKVFMVITLLSMVLYLSPYYRATKVVSSLDKQFHEAFGNVSGSFLKKQPLSMKELFMGMPYKKKSYETLAYQNIDNSLKLDFYKAGSAGRPCIIVIHGGGWDSGDSQQLADLNSYLVDAGYNVASINYRFAPKYNYPELICDVKDAFLYLRRNAARLSLDSTNFVFLGRSAGGQLALQAAYTFKDPNIKGVISYYAPADMVWGYSVPGNPLIMDSRKVLSNYLGGGCDLYPDKYKKSSPVEHVEAGSPPTLLFHGESDVLVAFEHSRRMNIKLQQAGVPHLLVNLPWATHGYDFNFSGPGSQITVYTIERFLKYVINKDKHQ